MAMPGRSFNAEAYIYGYQGSEKDNEISGSGNSYTTFFRQLDPRLGRWFSTDPVFQPWQSPYTSMDNNPINLNDVLGDKAHGDGDPGGKETVTASPGDGAIRLFRKAKIQNPNLTKEKFAEINNKVGLVKGELINAEMIHPEDVFDTGVEKDQGKNTQVSEEYADREPGWSVKLPEKNKEADISTEEDMEFDIDTKGPEPWSNKPLGNTFESKTRKQTWFEKYFIPDNQQELYEITEAIHPSHLGGGESPGGITDLDVNYSEKGTFDLNSFKGSNKEKIEAYLKHHSEDRHGVVVGDSYSRMIYGTKTPKGDSGIWVDSENNVKLYNITPQGSYNIIDTNVTLDMFNKFKKR